MRTLLAVSVLMLLTACSGDGESAPVASIEASPSEDAAVGPDGDALTTQFQALVSPIVQQQIDDGTPASALGRIIDTCPALDDQALMALADVVGVAGEEVDILRTTISDPGGANTLTCPLKFSDVSAGALVLSVGPTEPTVEGVRQAMLAQDFEEVEAGKIEGLAPEQVLLFDATNFDATRAIWTVEGFQVSLTANADLVDEGRLVELLPVAVSQITRVLEG